MDARLLSLGGKFLLPNSDLGHSKSAYLIALKRDERILLN